MLFGQASSSAMKETLLATVEGQVKAMYHRIYLPRGVAERTLLLLTSLLEVRM